MTLKESLLRFLATRRLPLILAAVALLLVLPSVWTGWQMDDFSHRYYLLGNPGIEGTSVSFLDMFSFISGDTVQARTMMDLGLLPWWTLKGLRLSFWRPLTGATHWLDYALWPDNAAMMHVQNLMWFAVLVAVAALLFRRFLGSTWIAGLAALMYALDDAHGLPAGWIASRNTVFASLFGMMMLLVHDRWRQQGWQPGAWLGPLFLALGLLAGEFALGVLGYLFAYALFLDPAAGRKRLQTLIPYGAVTLIWLLVYKKLGHGTWGSGFYADPFSEPLTFASAFVNRVPFLLLDQFGFPPAEVTLLLSPGQQTVFWIMAIVFVCFFGVLFLPLIRRDATARFWALGLALALLPISATMPSGRLLFFSGLGAMGLLAQWIAANTGQTARLPGSRRTWIFKRLIAVVFIAVHLVIAPAFLPWKSTSATVAEPFLQGAAGGISRDVDIRQKDVVFVNAPSVFFSTLTGAVRILNGDPLPRRFRALASGSAGLQITRIDERTLLVRPNKGFLADPFDALYRGPSHPLQLGTTVHVTNMTVKITKVTADNLPEEATFEFPVILEDPSLLFLRWNSGRYEVFIPPPLDSTVVLEPVPMY